MIMSKMKIGKYLSISWAVLATATFAILSERINNLEKQQNTQYSVVGQTLNQTTNDIEVLKYKSIAKNTTGEFE